MPWRKPRCATAWAKTAQAASFFQLRGALKRRRAEQIHCLSQSGVHEGQLAGMQHQAIRLGCRIFGICRVAIQAIAHDGVAQVLHVQAKLMRSACFGL